MNSRKLNYTLNKRSDVEWLYDKGIVALKQLMNIGRL